MDVKDLLENEKVKGLLKKFNIPPDKAEGFANQAMNAIKSKFGKDPKQMSSLLSKNANTENDEVLAKEVEDDFTDRLVKKVGLPESAAKEAKAALPGILEQVTSKLSEKGKNDEGGIAGMLGNITDMFDGDDDDAKKTKDGKA
ncbi:MAG: hypothetical protein ACI837_003542, partial [Crocinitomicaceae bacterium]